MKIIFVIISKYPATYWAHSPKSTSTCTTGTQRFHTHTPLTEELLTKELRLPRFWGNSLVLLTKENGDWEQITPQTQWFQAASPLFMAAYTKNMCISISIYVYIYIYIYIHIHVYMCRYIYMCVDRHPAYMCWYSWILYMTRALRLHDHLALKATNVSCC